jgi:hypothetical protein
MAHFSRNKQQNRSKPLEVRFNRVLSQLHACRTTYATRALEKDIAHTVNHIERYGFQWFPNVYVYDDVIQIEGMVRQLQHEQA